MPGQNLRSPPQWFAESAFPRHSSKCDGGGESRGLHASLFARATPVVWDRGNVFDQLDIQTSRLQRSDCTFAARARSLHADFNISHAELGCLFSGLLGSTLSCERGALAASLESTRASTCPAERVALGIGDGHSCVVECGVNVSDPVADIAPNSFFLVGLCHCKVSAGEFCWIEFRANGSRPGGDCDRPKATIGND